MFAPQPLCKVNHAESMMQNQYQLLKTLIKAPTELWLNPLHKCTVGMAILFIIPTASPLATMAQSPLPEETRQLVNPNPPAVPSAPRADVYLLGVGDFVRIDVFNVPDYGGEFRVLAGGVLNLPVAGEISVDGLSLPQAAVRVEQRLMPFVKRPRVTLSLLESRPLQVAIAGEVNRPGAYSFGEDTDTATADQVTLTQVIDLAGGITQSADISQIQVCRRQSLAASMGQLDSNDCPSSNGKMVYTPISIDFWTLLRNGDLTADLRLQDGDRIEIPTAIALSAEEQDEQARANISQDIIVNVVGEVAAPGAIQVPPNAPLNQAILTAGGFSTDAKKKRVTLIRLNSNGTVTEQEIAIDFSQGVQADTNPPLRPNDTIVVGRSTFARAAGVLGTVLSPANSILNIFRFLGD